MEDKELYDNWNDDIAEDIKYNDINSIVVYSRDWTVETICNQIKQGNIELNPKFQRRNAWTDERKSRLIESLILGLPVPEIILAENPERKRSYILIDGKQRLLTIASFFEPETVPYWQKGKLIGLIQKSELNGKTYYDLLNDFSLNDIKRRLNNADIRCTVVSGFKDSNILYDIFYRINTGSVSLSTQELRQVLNRGEFADYLCRITEEKQPIHEVMNLDGADNRLRDIEIILRYISIVLFGKDYNGNLKIFLDKTMATITKDWSYWKPIVDDVYKQFNESIKKLNLVFDYNTIGRKYKNNKFEKRFNKVLFEVQTYYFSFINEGILIEKRELLRSNFIQLCVDNVSFIRSLESSTKNIEQYRQRFDIYKNHINSTLGLDIVDIPIRI